MLYFRFYLWYLASCFIPKRYIQIAQATHESSPTVGNVRLHTQKDKKKKRLTRHAVTSMPTQVWNIVEEKVRGKN